MLIVGEKDTYNDPKLCPDLIQDYKQGGANIRLISIPNAQHGWDVVGNPSHWTNPHAQNFSSCDFRQKPDGPWEELHSKIVFRSDKSDKLEAPKQVKLRKEAISKCVRHGTSGGYNPTAAAQSTKIVLDILAKQFGEKATQANP